MLPPLWSNAAMNPWPERIWSNWSWFTRRTVPSVRADRRRGVGPVSSSRGCSVGDVRTTRWPFIDLVAGVRPGPLQERLGQLAVRVDAGVLAVWGTAQHAAELERVATLDPERVTTTTIWARSVSNSDLGAHSLEYGTVRAQKAE